MLDLPSRRKPQDALTRDSCIFRIPGIPINLHLPLLLLLGGRSHLKLYWTHWGTNQTFEKQSSMWFEGTVGICYKKNSRWIWVPEKKEAWFPYKSLPQRLRRLPAWTAQPPLTTSRRFQSYGGGFRLYSTRSCGLKLEKNIPKGPFVWDF